jgi:hypothetical protein
MKLLSLCLLASITLAAAVTPVSPPVVDTCADVPPVAAGAAYGLCKKHASGPTYNTDLVRTISPTGVQDWESWATLSATRQVCQLMVSASCQWVPKGSLALNPPAPVVTPPPPPPPVTATAVVTWAVPTQNVDGTTLTDLAGYNLYINGTKVAHATQPYTAAGLTPGTAYQFSVTALNQAGIESPHSATVTYTPAAPPRPVSTPKAPTNVTVTAGTTT